MYELCANSFLDCFLLRNPSSHNSGSGPVSHLTGKDTIHRQLIISMFRNADRAFQNQPENMFRCGAQLSCSSAPTFAAVEVTVSMKSTTQHFK